MLNPGSPKRSTCRFAARRLGLAGFLAVLLPFGAAFADTSAREEALKAAFLYNFAKFTEWPPASFAAPDSPMGFCFYGGSLGRLALDTLRGKSVRNRPVNVKIVYSLQNINSCHVIYLVGDTPSAAAEAAIEQATGAAVLVVSDLPGFARRGGHIGLVRQGNRLRFEINMAAASRDGLRFSSKLLQLAIIIDGNR